MLPFSKVDGQTVINSGVGGNTTGDLLERLETDVIGQKPDLVLLMVGTNDFLNSKRMLTYEKYRSNLIRILKRLRKADIEVVLMSSPTVDTIYLFDRHDSALYKESPNLTMQKAGEILESLSEEFGTGFIDLNQAFRTAGLPRHNEDDLIQNVANSGRKDGVHPTAKGYTFMVDLIYPYLLENGYLQKYDRILCFGDSITYGSNVDGAGTVQGDSYPAQLLARMR